MRNLRLLFLVPLVLAACESPTDFGDWTHEGVIETGFDQVAVVDQYAVITCRIGGDEVRVRTGQGSDGPHCLKLYSTVEEGGVVTPIHTLYVVGPVGRAYWVRVE